MDKSNGKSAFTLLELAIVLTIIGLMVGGVVGGRALVHSSKITGIIHDIQGYQTAVNLFQINYDALPGDMRDATAYWPSDSNVRNGNGNGLIDFTVGGGSGGHFQEDVQAWKHLVNAGLLHGTFTGDVVYFQTPQYKDSVNQFAKAIKQGVTEIFGIPSAQACYYQYSTGDNASIPGSTHIDDGAFWLVNPEASLSDIIQPPEFSSGNALLVGAIPDQYGSSVGLKVDGIFTPKDARSLDKKLDDGNPTTGIAMSQNGYNNGYATSNLGDDCLTGSNEYNVASKDRGCMLFYWLKK